MKVKVLKKFRDKETGEIRKQDDVFEADEGRIEEIMAKSNDLIEVLNNEEEEPKQGKEQEAAGDLCDIAQMTEEQLRELAKTRKIKGYTKMSIDELKEVLE